MAGRFGRQFSGEHDAMIPYEMSSGCSAACVLYTYVGYPLLLAVMARRWPRAKTGVHQPPVSAVSVVLAVYNEESRIGPRIHELVRLVAGRPAGGEVIVVSDGSTDDTVAEAQPPREAETGTGGRVSVRVLVQEPRQGKARALNRAHAVACHPFLVFADARQTWAADAIERLVAAFAEPTVGAVGGDLVLESVPASWRVSACTGGMRNACGGRKASSIRRSASRAASRLYAASCTRPSPPELSSTTSIGRCWWRWAATGSSMRSGPERSTGCLKSLATSFAARSERSPGIIS